MKHGYGREKERTNHLDGQRGLSESFAHTDQDLAELSGRVEEGASGSFAEKAKTGT
jgi:hypothetical protein